MKKKRKNEGDEEKQEIPIPNLQDYILIPDTGILISKSNIIGGYCWDGSHSRLFTKGLFMPTPSIFFKYFKSLIDSYNEKEKYPDKHPLYDGQKNLISFSEIKELYEKVVRGNGIGLEVNLDCMFVQGSGFLD